MIAPIVSRDSAVARSSRPPRCLVLFICCLAVALVCPCAVAAAFTSGNLAVLRVGDGVQALANTGNTIFIDEYTTNGVFVQSITVPDSGASALIISGSATSEGGLMRSPDGLRLAFAGYNTNRPAPASFSTLTSAQVPRGVATVDGSGGYALGAVSLTQYSANNIRSGATDGTNGYWGAGGTSGTCYLGTAAAAATLQSSISNTRVVTVFNGNLYFSTSSGTARGVYGFSTPGLSTFDATTNFIINAGAASSVFAFSINPASTVAYTIDDNPPTSTGGIMRWTNNAGAWSLAYIVNTNAGRGLVVDWSGADPVLYATTTTNSLIVVADTGAFSPSSLLVGGATSTALRGVAFAPASLVTAPGIASQSADTGVECGGMTNLSVTASGAAPFTYQWRRSGANIADATNATVLFPSATFASAGGYDVVVSNSGGSITSSVVMLATIDTTAPILSLPANLTVNRATTAATVVGYSAVATDACEGAVAIICVPASGSTFPPGVTLVSCQAHDSGNNTNTATFNVTVQEVVITVTNRVYAAYRTDLTNGYVYVDADVMAGSPVRASQRALGYREVDYKSQVPGTLFFNQAVPATNGNTVAYDYSTQTAKTNQVGFWVDKDVPFVIGPDGKAYITDGHHTTAGYLASNAPVRQFVPGLNRVILGHIVANYYNPTNPLAPDDTWWAARASENNAYLHGINGNALTQPSEPNYASLQPVMPSVMAMPNTPSAVGGGAMLNSVERSLAWGLADGILKSAYDRAGSKIVGYRKSAPGSSVDINFVEFYWADFLRNRIVWDNSRQGSPLGSTNGDASVTAAPLGFFAAVANGIALAKSEAYRDQYGRLLRNYTNNALFAPNTVNWANGSYSNGLAAPSNTFNLFLLDDSTIVGDITPSAVSTNILRINSTAGLTVTNTISNITRLLINGGTRIATTWKDATVTNTTLTFPGGAGDVTLSGSANVSGSTVISNGAFLVNGALTGGGSVNVWGGSLRGTGTINGAVSLFAGATLAPGGGIGTLTISGPLILSGTTAMEINKAGVTLTSDLITGVTALTYGGTLTVTAAGNALTAGDSFQLFVASGYSNAFTTLDLPVLAPGLYWDTTGLLTTGTITVAIPAAGSMRGLTGSTNGGFQLSFAGSAGARYAIQLNTNLNTTNWTTIAVLTNSTGTLSFGDTAATNARQGFYRAVSQ